jgi:hypothetical protein
MKITRQRLKNIIMEEISLAESMPSMVDMEADNGNAPANDGGMDEITEGEGMELVQQAAQTLIDLGILGADSPEELMIALKGLGKTALLPLAGAAMGGAAMAGKDAIDKLRSEKPPQEPEMPLEEDSMDTLTNLITQVVQEQIS